MKKSLLAILLTTTFVLAHAGNASSNPTASESKRIAQVVSLYKKNRHDNDTIQKIAFNASSDPILLEALLKNGLNPNLMFTAHFVYPEYIKKTVPYIEDGPLNSSLLNLVILGKQRGNIDLLLRYSADPNLPAPSGATPIQTAFLSNDVNVIDFMKDKIDCKKTCQIGSDSIIPDILLSPKPIEYLKYFLERGADARIKISIKKQSLLVIAAVVKQYDAIPILIAAGASATDKDTDGKSAIDRARERGDIRALRLLEETTNSPPTN